MNVGVTDICIKIVSQEKLFCICKAPNNFERLMGARGENVKIVVFTQGEGILNYSLAKPHFLPK